VSRIVEWGGVHLGAASEGSNVGGFCGRHGAASREEGIMGWGRERAGICGEFLRAVN